MEESEWTESVVRYVRHHRGSVAIPPDLEAFCRRYDVARDIEKIEGATSSHSPMVFISYTGHDSGKVGMAQEI